MKYVVIDLEMNPLAAEHEEERIICRDEVIQIGAVLLDEDFQEIGSFMTLVKPQYNDVVKPRIEKLTGITTEMVQSAPVFEEAINMFFSWCSSVPGDVEIHQWSESDYTQVHSEMQLKHYSMKHGVEQYFNQWCDFQHEYDTALGLERQVSLKQAIEYAGLDVDGRLHDALFDARNTANLLRVVRTPELCQQALEKVIEALKPKPMMTTLGSMFDFSQFDLSA